MVESYVLDLEEIDTTKVALAGGKGAHLGELLRIGGVRVPAGFCVTTDAFRRIMATAPVIGERLDRLSRLDLDDREVISALSAEIRQAVEDVSVPGDLAAEITRSVTALGEQTACAVRSSATAEDLPAASFAGQQDTYLNVDGTGRYHPARQPVLGLPVQRAGGDLPPAERLRPPQGPDGRRRAGDGGPAGFGGPLHCRPGYLEPEGRLGRSCLRSRRGPGVRPSERATSTRSGTARSSTGGVRPALR